MKIFITGGAGFIGSHLCEALLAQGHEVTAWDNFVTGHKEFLADCQLQTKFQLVKGDNLDKDALVSAMSGHETVIHLAANADVRYGLEHPTKDLQQNTIATSNILEAARQVGVQRVCFSSTGSVYGEPDVIPTPENAPFPVQTSLYAASKLAGEGLLQAYAHGYSIRANIYRFVSILGERYTHGHVLDFCRQLLTHPEYLEVLGDGQQRKSYLYVKDCVSAILTTLTSPEPVSIFNLGYQGTITVNESIAIICRTLGVNPQIRYSGGRRGWIGDSPLIMLDTSKIRSTGWEPTCPLEPAIERTIHWILQNRDLAFSPGIKL